MRDLPTERSCAGYIVWEYLSSISGSPDGLPWEFDIGNTEFTNKTGFTRKIWDAGIDRLIEKGYLVLTGGKTFYNFYEIPPEQDAFEDDKPENPESAKEVQKDSDDSKCTQRVHLNVPTGYNEMYPQGTRINNYLNTSSNNLNEEQVEALMEMYNKDFTTSKAYEYNGKSYDEAFTIILNDARTTYHDKINEIDKINKDNQANNRQSHSDYIGPNTGDNIIFPIPPGHESKISKLNYISGKYSLSHFIKMGITCDELRLYCGEWGPNSEIFKMAKENAKLIKQIYRVTE